MTARSLFGLWLWASVACGSAAGLAGESSRPADPIVKLIRQYALTSANDFPNRDPQDWRLLGSNDGGKTWTTLDVREGEAFSERHQQRVFRLANAAAFNLYRLQIDRVFGLGAADCVQLAEIGPMGEMGEDLAPVPVLHDVITAQGEHPPVETFFQAFDGQVETKWLDFARQNPANRASWIQWQYSSHTGLVFTNVEELLGLRGRAREGYPVQIEGVVAGRVPEKNTLCFVDATGHLDIPGGGEERVQFSPGERVLLEATSQWTNNQVGLRGCRLHLIGPEAPGKPKRIALEQPLAPAEELSWVEAEGVIQFCASLDNQLFCDLEDNNISLPVCVLHWGATNKVPAAGARVSVQGLCQSVLNAEGQRIIGTLWATSAQSISPILPDQPLTNSPATSLSAGISGSSAPVLTHIEQIRRLSPEELARGPRVKVTGVVTDVYGNYMQEGTAGIEVWLGRGSAEGLASLGSRVQVEGKGTWDSGHGPIIRAEKILPLGKGKMPRAEHCSWSQLVSGKVVDQWVEIEAVVRSTDGSHVLLDGGGGQIMATIRSAPASLVKRLVDAVVRIRGVSIVSSDSRRQVQGIQLLVPSLAYVDVIEAAADPFSLPTRPIDSLLQLRSPTVFTHRTKVRGVLTFQEGRNYFLQDATGGGVLVVAHTEVNLNFDNGRQNWMFWQSANHHSTPGEETRFEVGDLLEVAGFPETRGFSPILAEALVRKVGKTNSVAPIQTQVEAVFAGTLDSTLVTLEARLLRQEVLGPNLVCELQSGQRVFQAVLPEPDRGHASVPSGSRVQVTGICQIDTLAYPELGKRVASFKLLMRSPADLLILERPSWWTMAHVIIMVGALAMFLAIAAGWIGLLRRQVEERTQQLQQEVKEHEQTEAQLAAEAKRVQAEIEERKRIEAEVEKSHRQLIKTSRLAGMTEVATSVLHNVGNVLNSANVLASRITEQVRTSKVSSVSRVVELLDEHQAELGRFLTEDESGRELPGYLKSLAAHLEQEHSKLLDKTQSLTESLHHIKEIVATQQNYAKISGVLEQVSLAEIAEDALRIHSGALARHHIKVERDYQETPPATLDRHKTLQILFNLLENAKHACEASGHPDKQIMVRIRNQGPGRVQLVVRDNGIGIPPENLVRIFQQGFSTRKGGHGFGLHSSVLAAQDMGGSLGAQSEGPGHGATFLFEVPLRVGEKHRNVPAGSPDSTHLEASSAL